MKYYEPSTAHFNWVHQFDANGNIVGHSTVKPGFWFDDMDDLTKYLRNEHGITRYHVAADGTVSHGLAIIGYIKNSPNE